MTRKVLLEVGKHGVGRAWNPGQVSSSELPDRLQRVIGDEQNDPAARGACHTKRSWYLMFLLVVGHGIDSRGKGMNLVFCGLGVFCCFDVLFLFST